MSAEVKPSVRAKVHGLHGGMRFALPPYIRDHPRYQVMAELVSSAINLWL